MIQSMTGYGKAIVELPDKKINVEIKSLNSKAMDLSARIAPAYREKEMEIRNEIARVLERGKVDFSLWVEKKDAEQLATPINQELVAAYYHRIKEISSATGIPEPEDWFGTLLRLPDVMTKTETQELSEEEWQVAHTAVEEALNHLEYAGISIPMAVLIWIMIYPMMMKVDFKSIKNIGKNPKGLFVTWIVNWLIKPFTMYGIASFFFFVVFKTWITPDLATEYLAGAVLLGAAPCTAMVFVWSTLTKGNPAYTVVQVASNGIIILFAFVPIVKFLLGVSNVSVPFQTLFMSVVLFVVIPLAAGIITRLLVVRKKGTEYFEQTFLHKFDSATTVGLLLTLILIFMFQGEVVLDNPLHIILIAVPLIIQTFFIFFLAFGVCRIIRLPYDIAAPAGMIGASNFFELAVAVAVALFGTSSPAALATTVGVLTEVPVMLTLVKIANKLKEKFKYE